MSAMVTVKGKGGIVLGRARNTEELSSIYGRHRDELSDITFYNEVGFQLYNFSEAWDVLDTHKRPVDLTKEFD